LDSVPPALACLEQLREAFPESCPYRYAILDRDGKFGQEVTDLLTASGMKLTRISPACPWQNGVAERWIGSCRRELLDHLIYRFQVHESCGDRFLADSPRAVPVSGAKIG